MRQDLKGIMQALNITNLRDFASRYRDGGCRSRFIIGLESLDFPRIWFAVHCWTRAESVDFFALDEWANFIPLRRSDPNSPRFRAEGEGRRKGLDRRETLESAR